jgi:signal recognition particle subunit SRP54
MQQVKKMGPIGNLMGMMPGMPKELRNAQIEDKEINRVEAIIRSMTPQERAYPEMIDGSRRSRIAGGSGATVSEVSLLVKQFGEVQKMMKRMANMPGVGRKMKKGKKGKKGPGGRAIPPPPPAPAPFQLPGLN